MCPFCNNTTAEVADERYNYAYSQPYVSHTDSWQPEYWNLSPHIFFTWLFIFSSLESLVYESLTNKKLMNGIKQASPTEQTSCLEGFHSTLNQFAPKMVAYSFVGMFFRYGNSIQKHIFLSVSIQSPENLNEWP